MTVAAKRDLMGATVRDGRTGLTGKVIGIVGGLREGLDLENHADSLADLDSLYAYMSKRLVEANVQNDPEILNEVARLLITVKEGWDAIGE